MFVSMDIKTITVKSERSDAKLRDVTIRMDATLEEFLNVMHYLLPSVTEVLSEAISMTPVKGAIIQFPNRITEETNAPLHLVTGENGEDNGTTHPVVD